MNTNYNIPQLFDIAFGIKSVGVYDINAQNTEEITKMSHLGTPIVFPMAFKGKGYQIFNEQGDVVQKQFEDFELPNATLVNFRRAKIITKTKALAAKGTVKEMYGFDDWRIDIRGLCLPDPSHATAKTAEAQKLRILAFEEIVDSIRVSGVLFEHYKISNITIDEITINQLKGKPDVIPFYIRCSSDEPLELIL